MDYVDFQSYSEGVTARNLARPHSQMLLAGVLLYVVGLKPHVLHLNRLASEPAIGDFLTAESLFSSDRFRVQV